ncbi:MAG: DUF6174 domain-containing protein [Isosphaeraceae bacterium]
MSRSRFQPVIRRGGGPSLRAGALLIASCLVLGCSGGEAVTPEALARAKATWGRAGLKDYDLEWTSSGIATGHYSVVVRGGSVRKVQSVAPDGRLFELHPAEPRFYGVDGLFTTIADELAQLKQPLPFGQPAGTKVVMRFTTDRELGYPRSYRRNVLGTPQGLSIDVIRLVVSGASPGAGEASR